MIGTRSDRDFVGLYLPVEPQKALYGALFLGFESNVRSRIKNRSGQEGAFRIHVM